MNKWLKPRFAIAAALVVLVVFLILQRGRESEPGSLGAEDFMRISEIDRSLPGAETGSGREAFRETIDASEATSMTFEIPPGMAIYVEAEITGGAVHLILDPSWTDPLIVELGEGATTRLLIANQSQNSGRINIRSTPIGEVQGSFSLYGE